MRYIKGTMVKDIFTIIQNHLSEMDSRNSEVRWCSKRATQLNLTIHMLNGPNTKKTTKKYSCYANLGGSLRRYIC